MTDSDNYTPPRSRVEDREPKKKIGNIEKLTAALVVLQVVATLFLSRFGLELVRTGEVAPFQLWR